MHEITRKEQDQLLKQMRRHRKRLMAYPNVRAVDVGFAFRRKRPSDRLAIRVHVRRKVPDSKLADAERLPEEIDGIPVDVIQSDPELLADFRNSRRDPVLGGVNMGNVRTTGPGTLGTVVFDRDTLEPFALSALHVMSIEPPIDGDPVIQPDLRPPGADSAQSALGHLRRYDLGLDAAICTITTDGAQGRRISTALTELPRPASGSRRPLVGLRVLKSGLRTGVTSGIIDGTNGVEFSLVPDDEFMPPGAPFGGPGDSGAIWLDRNTFEAVGVLFKGQATAAETRIWANSVPAIEEKLNVRVLRRAAVGTAWIGTRGRVIAATRPGAPCHLRIGYPSGRISSAVGLGPKEADEQGIVRWSWRIGTSVKRNAHVPMSAFLTLDGQQVLETRELEGHTDFTH